MSCSRSSRLASSSLAHKVMPVRLPPGRLRLSTSPILTGSAPRAEHDGDGRGRGLGRQADRVAADGDKHIGPGRHHLGGKLRHVAVAAIAPAHRQGHVLAVDVSRRLQPLEKGIEEVRIGRLRAAAEIGDARKGRRLRPRRRSDSRDAGRQQKMPALHSMTSSAWASRLGGRVRPSVLAVFLLITSSKAVGCSIGRLAGDAPPSTRMTYQPTRL